MGFGRSKTLGVGIRNVHKIVGWAFPTFWHLQAGLGPVRGMGVMMPDMIWIATAKLDFPIF